MYTLDAILNRLNELIIEEKGTRVRIDQKMSDSHLDSFGVIFVVASLEQEYGDFTFDLSDMYTLSIQELIHRVQLNK